MSVDQRRHEEEFSLLELANIVLRRRGTVIACTLLGVVFALVMALRTPLEFTATASFLPNSGDEGALQSVAGLAQQFGLAIPTAGAERSPEFYQDLIRSRRILDGLIDSRFEVSTPTGVTSVDLAEHFEIEGESPEQQRALTRRLLVTQVTSVEVARATGVVTVRIQTDDAELSAAMGRRLLELISAFDLETRRSRASAERGFSQERLSELQLELSVSEDSLKSFMEDNRQFSNSPQLTFEHGRLERRVAMRQEMVTAMAQVFERARIDEVRTTPVMTVIDDPEAPALPDRRGRLLKLLLGLTLGAAMGLGLALVTEYAARTKKEGGATYSELRRVLREMRADILGLRRPSSVSSTSTDPGA